MAKGYDERTDLLAQIKDRMDAVNATRPAHVAVCWDDAWASAEIGTLYDVKSELNEMLEG